MLSKISITSALAASASAHMIMNFPTPFGRSTLDKSPLAPADFPCKQRPGVYEIGTMNQWDAGQTQTVSFNGTAVHGGGSCQFSITTDPEPTVNSQWKVIKSVVGGCPTGEFEGNAPEVASTEPMLVPLKGGFPVTMPADIPDGRYTFAWTWLNKVGNREFYMNCAPVQVGNGQSSAPTEGAAKALAALPDMFVANLPNTECSTPSGQDFVYPSPGSAGTATGAGCAKQNAMGAGAGSIGSPSAGTPSAPSPSTPSTPSQGTSTPSQGTPTPSDAQSPTVPKTPSNPGGAFAPGASAAPATPSSVAQPVAPAKGLTPPVANSPPATPQQPSNTTPTNGQCTPCNNEGAMVCMGSSHFGICDRGCAVPRPMAPGVPCTDGVAVASTKKRHIHFPRAHLHRSLSAAHLI